MFALLFISTIVQNLSLVARDLKAPVKTDPAIEIKKNLPLGFLQCYEKSNFILNENSTAELHFPKSNAKPEFRRSAYHLLSY